MQFAALLVTLIEYYTYDTLFRNIVITWYDWLMYLRDPHAVPMG